MTSTRIEHTNTGNCWNKAGRCREYGVNNLCDVCHQHEEPRGECAMCPPCEACEMNGLRGVRG